MAAHIRGVGFATDDKDMSVTLVDGRLGFGAMDLDTQTMVEGSTLIDNPIPPQFSSRVLFLIAHGKDDWRENKWLNGSTFLPEDRVPGYIPPVVLTRVKLL